MRLLLLCLGLIFVFTTYLVQVETIAANDLSMSKRRIPLSQIIIVVPDMVVEITPDSGIFAMGETVTVAVDVENNSYVQGCNVSSYEISLAEESSDLSLFEFISPSVVTDINSSATFTLTATSTGATMLLAPVTVLYECGNQLNIDIQDYGLSEPFFVWAEIHQNYLPLASK